MFDIDKAWEQVYDFTDDLVYIGYGDRLTDEQVRMVFDGDIVQLDDEVWEDFQEARFEGARYIVDDIIEGCGGFDELEELQGVDAYETWDMMVEQVIQQDTCDYVLELARWTPEVTAMVPLIDEDHAQWGANRKPSQLLESLGVDNAVYAHKARRLIDESCTDLGMAYAVFDVEVADLLNGGPLRVDSPTVVYGNPFTGAGWAEVFEGVTLVVNTEDIMPDGSWGYDTEDIFGGLICSEAEPVQGRDVTRSLPVGSMSYVDPLIDYIAG